MVEARSYIGYIDRVDSAVIYGWVAKSNSRENVIVELYIDGNLTAEFIADQLREDVKEAGHGDGNHGFSIEIPRLNPNKSLYSIELKVKNTDFIIDGGIKEYDFVLENIKNISPPAISSNEKKLSITVIMPTYNRGALMEATLERFLPLIRESNSEIIIIDDGSKDDTPERLARLASQNTCLRYESIKNGGPGRARNRAASIARGDILVFVGDDVSPIDNDFLAYHLAAHQRYPNRGQAVLGKIVWPEISDFDVNFVMSHIQGEGEQQFGYRYMMPYSWYTWNLFYSSNISIKSSLVEDWEKEGFREEFYLAAFEDPEFGLRTHERLRLTSEKFEILYLPVANLVHYHKYDVESFIRRQVSAGLMANEFLKLHPGREKDLGLADLTQRLNEKGVGQEFPLEHYLSVFEGIRSWAIIIDKHYGLGSQNWHADLIKSVFQLAYYEGYIRAQSNKDVNIANACRYMLERVRVLMNRAVATEVLGGTPGFGIV